MELLKLKQISLFAVSLFKIFYFNYLFLLAKPKIDVKPTDVTCLINETAKLNVKFTAIPKATITWHKSDGTEIQSNDRIQIITDDDGQSTLIINNSTIQDSQGYIVRAINKVGSLDTKINLSVKGNK